MYLIPRDAMANKLEPAWVFLSGSARHFVQGQVQDSRPGEREHTIVLPVHLHADRPARLMAVCLLIDDSEAVDVARFMFGIPTGEVSADDVTDACKEACNVMGGALIMSDQDKHTVEIGIPQEIPSDRFSELRRHAVISVTFASENDAGRRVVITVFDAIDQRILES